MTSSWFFLSTQVNKLHNFTHMCHFLNLILPFTFHVSPAIFSLQFFLIISFAFLVYAIRPTFSAHLVDWCDHCHTVWLRSAIYETIKFMRVCMNTLAVKKVRTFQYGKKKQILPNVNAYLKLCRIMKSEYKH